MNSILRPALAAALLLLVPTVAQAQSAPAPAATSPPGQTEGDRPMAACRADVDTLCPGTARGERRKCLQDNQAKLSPTCQSALTEMQARAKAMREACAGDVKSHCAGIESAGGQLVQCLRTNVAKLSPTCGAAFLARHPKG